MEYRRRSFPALLALSFLHCRNVSTRTVDPPAKLSAKHARKRGVPLYSYRVIDIAPMQAVLEKEGGVSGVGVQKALHICRGHFKTYTEQAPLFGQHAGTWFWADTVRGDPAAGLSMHDYRVKR